MQETREGGSREMPKYKCHKEVWALKIATVDADTGILTPVDDNFTEISVTSTYIEKHNPQAGGYYVVYEDGYKSYSPEEPFEAGYTLIEEEEKQDGPQTKDTTA